MLSAYSSSLTSNHVTSEKLSPNLRDKTKTTSYNMKTFDFTLSMGSNWLSPSNFKIQTDCLNKALHRLQYHEETSRKIVIFTVSLQKSQ